MRTAADLAGIAMAQLPAVTSDVSPPPVTEPPAMWLRRLWERMAALYGHAWTSVHGVTPHTATGALTMSGSTWAGALAGLSGPQVAAGVEACIALGGEFPPNAPRFRAMCLAIPALEAVRTELQRGEPSTFARAVWAELDVFRFRQAPAEQADRMLQAAYSQVRDRVMRGEQLPAPPVAAIQREERKHVRATPEQQARHCARIRALLQGGAP